jgi:hypothetical protein
MFFRLLQYFVIPTGSASFNLTNHLTALKTSAERGHPVALMLPFAKAAYALWVSSRVLGRVWLALFLVLNSATSVEFKLGSESWPTFCRLSTALYLKSLLSLVSIDHKQLY